MKHPMLLQYVTKLLSVFRVKMTCVIVQGNPDLAFAISYITYEHKMTLY